MKLFALLIFATLLLNGCLPGNAEGYGNKPSNGPTGNGQQSPSLIGPRHYYLIDPNYTCTLEDGTLIKSYKDHILLENLEATSLGDRCNEKSGSVDLKNIVLSQTGQYLAYENKIYLYIDGTVSNEVLASLRPIEALCTTTATSGPYYDIAIRKPILNDGLTAHLQSVSQDFYVNVLRQDLALERKYTGMGVELTIRLDNVGIVHAGMLNQKEMNCRFQEE